MYVPVQEGSNRAGTRSQCETQPMCNTISSHTVKKYSGALLWTIKQYTLQKTSMNHSWLLHHNTPAHMSQKTTEFVTNNNMVIVPHPPYSPGLAPCDFTLFPKLKMKLCLTSKGNRKQYSTALRKMTSTVLLKRGKNYGITVHVPKENILKEMAPKIE
jgi:hypothetical protein